MPNGWYPVSGLDVVLIHRTEQRYPRHEWDQSWNSLWAVQFTGAGGFAPRGEFRLPAGTQRDPVEDLIKGAQDVVAGDPMQGTAAASAAYVDFQKKAGFACGVFSVYGFQKGSAEILLDVTWGGDLPKDLRLSADSKYLDLHTTYIGAAGLHAPGKPSERFRFQFAGMDALVVSSEPLHYDAHWPPKNSLDCVAMALAKPRQQDAWVALWKAADS